jgi:3-oxoacyl-[acyl-carrier-protein] synthase-1
MTRASATSLVVESRWVDGGGCVLLGQGLACALGYDAPTAMAAARAGLSRAAAQPHLRVRSEVTGDEQPVVAHAAALLSAGFEGRGRLQRLSAHAWTQLQSNLMAMAEVAWGRVGLYLALPDPGRIRSCGALMRQPAADEEASPIEGVSDSARALARQLTGGSHKMPQPSSMFWSAAGHAAGAVAMAAGLRDLVEGTIDTAMVLAIDSLLDEDTVIWLTETSRLKSDGRPDGLMPGEAAVAFAIRRGTEVAPGSGWAGIEGVSFADEPNTQDSGATSGSEGLARAVAQAHARQPGEPAWVVGDHNGEHYRAHEWGLAMARLRAAHPAFASPTFWWPATSFGDVGAAGAPLGAMLAGHAWQRACAPAAAALVACSADSGMRATLLLTRR